MPVDTLHLIDLEAARKECVGQIAGMVGIERERFAIGQGDRKVVLDQRHSDGDFLCDLWKRFCHLRFELGGNPAELPLTLRRGKDVVSIPAAGDPA